MVDQLDGAPSKLLMGKSPVNMKLEKVIGMSMANANSIAVSPVNSDVYFLAGCHIVVYNQKENKQVRHIASRGQKPLQCLSFSVDGKYLAAGENAFRQPEITVYELSYDKQTNQVSAIEEKAFLKGHKYGVEALRFSKDSRFLVSLGDPNDRGLFVWDWRNETKVSSNKLSKPVTTLVFSDNNDFFVTGGYQHLKYWYLDEETNEPLVVRQGKQAGGGAAIMESKTANLEKVRVKVFVGVAVHDSVVYALTADGYIYVFDKARKLLRWMHVKVDRAFSVCVSAEGRLVCACSDGIMRLFKSGNLEHIKTMSRPPPLGDVNILIGAKNIKIPATERSRYADVTASIYDERNGRIIAVYSDRMILVWDVNSLSQITVYRTFMSHCAPIHDIEPIPNSLPLGTIAPTNQKLASSADQTETEITKTPADAMETDLTKFVTCSSDRTIRFWHNVDPITTDSQKFQSIRRCLAQNTYCRDMSKVIFVQGNSSDGDGRPAAHLSNQEQKDQSQSNGAAAGSQKQNPFKHFQAPPLDRTEDGTPVESNQKNDSNFNRDLTDAIRCVKVSPDGRHLACGDWMGNIRIYEICGTKIEQIKLIEAHDHEVICLAYSPALPLQQQGATNCEQQLPNDKSQTRSRFWLASGSRDKNILVFDSAFDYQAVTALEQHQSTITSLFFTCKPDGTNLQLISSSADKTISQRQVDLSAVQNAVSLESLQLMSGDQLFKCVKKEVCKNKVFSMGIASEQSQFMVSGHERQINLWKLPELTKIWEQNTRLPQEVHLRTYLDPTASVIISSNTNKSVAIYEAASGKPIAYCSPGEITTAMCLSSNMRQLITASDHGVIYIWRLPESLGNQLQKLRSSNVVNSSKPEDASSDQKLTAQKPLDQNQPIGQASLSSAIVEGSQKRGEPVSGCDDFNFELENEQDSQEESKQESEVKNVIAQIAQATNLIAGLKVPQTQEDQLPTSKDYASIEKPLDGKTDQSLTQKSSENSETQSPALNQSNPLMVQRKDLPEWAKSTMMSPGDNSNPPIGESPNEYQAASTNKEVLAISYVNHPSGQKQQDELQVLPAETCVENLVSEPTCDGEDDRIILESRRRTEYANRFVYYGCDDPEEAEDERQQQLDQILQSQDHLKLHRQSVTSQFARKLITQSNLPVEGALPQEEVASSEKKIEDLQTLPKNSFPLETPKVQTQMKISYVKADVQEICTDIFDDSEDVQTRLPTSLKKETNSAAKTDTDSKANAPSSQPSSGARPKWQNEQQSEEKQDQECPISEAIKQGTKIDTRPTVTSVVESVSGVEPAAPTKKIFGLPQQKPMVVEDFDFDDLQQDEIENQSLEKDEKKPPESVIKSPATFQKPQSNKKNSDSTTVIKPSVQSKRASSLVRQGQQMRSPRAVDPVKQNKTTLAPKASLSSKEIEKDRVISKDVKAGAVDKPVLSKAESQPNFVKEGARNQLYQEPLNDVTSQAATVKQNKAFSKPQLITSEASRSAKTSELALSERNKKAIIEESKDDSVVVYADEPKTASLPQADLNEVLQSEMTTITQSLARVTSLLSQQSIPGPCDSITTCSLREDVTASIQKNVGLWNTMMNGLNQRTDLNVQSLARGSAVSSQMCFLDEQQSQMQSSSVFSQVSIKEDAKDLLDKYSKLLIEQISAQMQKGVGTNNNARN